MIVSFSGIDSAGKSTQLDLLRAYCDEQDLRYVSKWSKARGTPLVVFLKKLVRRDGKLDDAGKQEYRKAFFANPKKEKFLYRVSMLDLCWYWSIHYRLLNLTHRYVFCDRYLWDTAVELQFDFPHVDLERSILWKILRKIAAKPKVSFVFFVPAEVSLERDRQKNAAGIEDIEMKRQKIAAYRAYADQGCWTHIMDGLRSREELHAQVLQALGLNKGDDI